MNHKIKMRIYKNGTGCKIKNSRIYVESLDEKEFGLVFETLSNELSPRATHEVIKNKVVITTLKISEEAAVALYHSLKEELNKLLDL